MLFRLSTARGMIGLTAATCLAGCAAWQQTAPPPAASSQRAQAPSRVVPDSQPNAELRIPGQAVAQAGDIPVVPLPPIPLGQGNTVSKTTPPAQPEIKQVSTLPPPPQPAPSTETPASAPSLPTPPVVSTVSPAILTRPAAPAPGDVKQIVQRSNETYTKLDSYIARLTRREQINGKSKPEEVMLFKFRKQPWSVYFKWLSTEGHGREVVFVQGQHEGKVHTLLAAGDVPLMAAGKRMALDPDGILFKSASRNPITEAGIGASIDRMTRLLTSVERGDKSRGTFTDLGEKKRDDYPAPLRFVEHAIPPGVETEMPNGGKRLYGFDTETYLPVLLFALDNKGQEVEYYRYDRMQLGVKLDDADFNPDKLWAPGVKSAQAKP